VLDSVGIGELPDAPSYGDAGSNTLGNIARRMTLQVPTLRALGLDRIAALGGGPPNGAPSAAIGRMAEASPGKDSVTGHWELMGIVLDRPFPVFPFGFASEIIGEFSRQTRVRLEIVGGLVEGRVMDGNQVRQTADLPSREVLLAQLLGTLQSPIAQLVGTIQAPVQQLVGLLEAYKNKLEAQA